MIYSYYCTGLQFCAAFGAFSPKMVADLTGKLRMSLSYLFKGNIYFRKRPERYSTYQSIAVQTHFLASLVSLRQLFECHLAVDLYRNPLRAAPMKKKAFSMVSYKLSGHRVLQLSLSLRHKAADLIANSKFRGLAVCEWEHCSRDHLCGEKAEGSKALQLWFIKMTRKCQSHRRCRVNYWGFFFHSDTVYLSPQCCVNYQ